MNILDIIIIAVLIIFSLKGFLRGLVNEVSSLTGLVLGSWLAYRFHTIISVPIRTLLHLPVGVSAFAAFVLILLASGIIAHIIGNLITTALRLVLLGGINRLGGAVIGAAEGSLILSLLFCMATGAFMPEQLRNRIHASESANMFAHAGDSMIQLWRGSAMLKP